MIMTAEDNVRRLALYHPWPHLSHRRISSWLKTMLLFFDGVALLAPPEAIETLAPDDQVVVRTLSECGLFHLLNPCMVMDSDSADRIMAFILQTSASFWARDQNKFARQLTSEHE